METERIAIEKFDGTLIYLGSEKCTNHRMVIEEGLAKGIVFENAWLVGLDLSNLDTGGDYISFANSNMSGVDMSGVDFTKINMRDVRVWQMTVDKEQADTFLAVVGETIESGNIVLK